MQPEQLTPKKVRRFLGHTKPVDYCQACQCESFVIDRRFTCCGRHSDLAYVKEVKKKIRRPNASELRDLRAKFERAGCFYCMRPFGIKVKQRGRMIQLRYQLDHILPWSRFHNNGDYNFAAACHVCNFLKGDRIFPSIEATRQWLARAWLDKGYKVIGY